MREELLEEVSAKCEEIINCVAKVFVGKPQVIRKLLAAALANGHVLLEDYPGLGKTLMVKALAKTIGCKFTRVQFTPDLLPADIIGTKVWRPSTGSFELIKGPIFTNVLLADEINRSPPKTQSALLEAMEERQITIEGETYRLEEPFFVLATQNPIEMEGTYPLPEAQLDRFMLKMSVGYPEGLEEEVEILRRRIGWRKDDPTTDLKAVITAEEFRGLQRAVEEVYVDRCILEYIARIVRSTRRHPKVEVGSSPRGALALMKASKALALIKGRDFVTPDDVKEVAVEALAHRIVLKMDYAVEGAKGEEVVREVISSVPVPKDYGPG